MRDTATTAGVPASPGAPPPGTRRRRPVVWVSLVLWGLLLGGGVWWAGRAFLDFVPSQRTTPRYDPPVWAGQNVPGACSGGFYARRQRTIVLTIVGHCATPGDTLRELNGRFIGTFGARAELEDCPAGRFCAPSDFLTLALARDRIPWGHLDLIDMGAGGYRQLSPGTAPLACEDVAVGDRVEIDGRERYRTGRVIAIGPYEHETDTIFPCMIFADIHVGVGDSGGAVLVNGLPAGVIARELGSNMGFTPLAEGLDDLGLTLCTTPDCDLAPETVEQPSG
jgi:hypothetical protein